MTDKKFTEIYIEIMEDLYQKSIPSGSFKKLIEESPRDENGAIHIPYINYRIKQEVYEYVLDYHFKKHRLDEPSRSRLRVSIAMGPSPSYI